MSLKKCHGMCYHTPSINDYVNKICCHIIRVGNLYRLEEMGVGNKNGHNYKSFSHK